MEKQFVLKDLAALVSGEIYGDPDTVVNGFGSLEAAESGDLSFLAKKAGAELLESTAARAVIVPVDITKAKQSLIRVKDPYLAAAIIQNHMLKRPFQATGVHQAATIGDECIIPTEVSIGAQVVLGNRVRIGKRVTIEPGTVIGDDVAIGEDCIIKANVTIYHASILGQRVTIHSGTVIGSDGYGYAHDALGNHVKRPQTGIVKIDDDVEIGANCCVDRATFGVTWIKSGTKIDNLVQVAHNVEVGENCLLVGQVGISGSVTLGRNVVFGGGAAAAGHQVIGDGTMIAGASAVHGDQDAGSKLAGVPAIPVKTWFRAASSFGKLPDLVRDMRKMKKELDRLSSELDDKDEGVSQ